jgi:hypothetical protein
MKRQIVAVAVVVLLSFAGRSARGEVQYTAIDLGAGYAFGINDKGWVVGDAVGPTGQTDAVLLIPMPEPSTSILLGIGAISVFAYALRRRHRVA